MEVKINVTGVERVKAMMQGLPKKVVKAGMAAFTEWMLGNQDRGLRHYSPYKYITRKRAYGKSFSSPQQRAKVMAMIRSGEILPGYPRRTGRTQRGWYKEPTRDGYVYRVGNKEKGAYYTRHETGQARLNALAGWRKMGAVIKTNMLGAIRHAKAAVSAALKG